MTIWRFLNRARLSARRCQRARRPRRLELERLEERTLLDGSIPLNTTAWTPIGPSPIVQGVTPRYSGRITGIAADPSDPTGGTVYITAAEGGVWKTTDANDPLPEWVPLTDQQPTLSMGAIAVAPS
jgi:hypothetical protein